MGSGIFYPAVSGDDGYLNRSSSSFSNVYRSIVLGSMNSAPYDSFVRFTNVTIPRGSNVSEAYLRFTSQNSETATIVNVQVFFNAVDDAVAPTNASEMTGLSLTTSINWNGLSGWSDGSKYNSPDLKTILQPIVDRGGWVSGQAVMAVIKDNSSTTNARRRPSSFDWISGAEKVELHITWTGGVEVIACPAFESTSELIATIQPQLAVPAFESVTTLACASIFFGQFLECPPFESTSELIATIQPQLACPPFESTSELIATIQPQLACPPFISASTLECASIFYGKLLVCPPFISISELIATIQSRLICPPFESASELIATIQPQIAVPAFESVTTLECASIWDGAAWKAWIAVNGKRLTRLYYFTLTGDADGVPDITIPMSSWQARRKAAMPTFLAVVIPGTAYRTAIDARTHGVMQVAMAYILDGVEQYREIVCRADYEKMRVDKGGRNQSMTLTGHRTESFGSKVIDLQDVVYISDDDGDYRYRCASCDMYLNPGDTARYDGHEITVNQIVYAISTEGQSMDVEEAAT